MKQTTELLVEVSWKNFLGSGGKTERLTIVGDVTDETIHKAYKRDIGLPGIGAYAKIYRVEGGQKTYILSLYPIYSTSFNSRTGERNTKVDGRRAEIVKDETHERFWL